MNGNPIGATQPMGGSNANPMKAKQMIQSILGNSGIDFQGMGKRAMLKAYAQNQGFADPTGGRFRNREILTAINNQPGAESPIAPMPQPPPPPPGGQIGFNPPPNPPQTPIGMANPGGNVAIGGGGIETNPVPFGPPAPIGQQQPNPRQAIAFNTIPGGVARMKMR
jgi:hypothetical protein